VSVVGRKVIANSRQIDKPVNLAQHVIVRDVPLQAEAVEQRLLHHRPFAHHRPNLLSPREVNQHLATASSGVFQHNRSKADVPKHAKINRYSHQGILDVYIKDVHFTFTSAALPSTVLRGV
jgi:hypothetical protein